MHVWNEYKLYACAWKGFTILFRLQPYNFFMLLFHNFYEITYGKPFDLHDIFDEVFELQWVNKLTYKQVYGQGII